MTYSSNHRQSTGRSIQPRCWRKPSPEQKTVTATDAKFYIETLKFQAQNALHTGRDAGVYLSKIADWVRQFPELKEVAV